MRPSFENLFLNIERRSSPQSKRAYGGNLVWRRRHAPLHHRRRSITTTNAYQQASSKICCPSLVRPIEPMAISGGCVVFVESKASWM